MRWDVKLSEKGIAGWSLGEIEACLHAFWSYFKHFLFQRGIQKRDLGLRCESVWHKLPQSVCSSKKNPR